MNFISNSFRNSQSQTRFQSPSALTSSTSLATFASDTRDSELERGSENGRLQRQRLSQRSISRHIPAGSDSGANDAVELVKGILNLSEIGSYNDKSEEKKDSKVNGMELLDEALALDSLDDNETENDSDLENFDTKMKKYEELRATLESTNVQLLTLQSYLSERQIELEALSTEMVTLETRSKQISEKLEAKQTAEGKLAPILEALIVPPNIVRQIADGEISVQWRTALKYISRRQHELDQLKKQGEFGALKAAQEQLELVTQKAIERIRDFAVTRIKSLRVAGVNAQAIQKDLLDYRELYSFVLNAHPELAEGLKTAYINTMRWYYGAYFARYAKALEKLNLVKVDRTVLLGTEDTTRRGGLLFLNRPSQTSMRTVDSLSLGNRANIVSSDDPSVMLAQIAESNNMAHHMETGYRSFNLALIDNVAVEYYFLTEFFQLSTRDQVNPVFNKVFERAFQAGNEYTKFLTEDTFDVFGLLICIRLTRKLEFELQHRRIPVAEGYLNLQLLNLWPRVQSVMDAHCDSLRRASTKSSVLHPSSSSATSALVPHHLTQSFASFLAGLLTLCDDETEPVGRSLIRLRDEFEALITKIASSQFPDTESKTGASGQKKRETFLYNNYFLVSTILSDVTYLGATHNDSDLKKEENNTSDDKGMVESEKEHFRLLTEAYEKKSEK